MRLEVNKTNHPPKFPVRFFRWYCNPEFVEDIEGDLLERFEKRKEKGESARWLFTMDVLRLFRPGIIKNFEGKKRLNYYGMLKTDIKVSLRNLLRYKTYTSINLIGFIIGLGIAMSMFWIVRFEKSFDTHHEDYDRIYQLMGIKDGENGSQIPRGVIATLNREFPEVELAISVHRYTPDVIRVDGENLQLERAYFVDPEVFKLLDIKWIAGDPESSLNSPDQTVIDLPTSKRLFGLEDPIGKVIRFDNNRDYIVSGLIAQAPKNSEFPFQMLMNISSHPWKRSISDDDWGGGDSTFKGIVKLKNKSEVAIVQDRISKIASSHRAFDYTTLEFVPIDKVHTHPDNDPFNYYTPTWILDSCMLIGLVIIIVSITNFVNLSTAQTIIRQKSIAVRKIMGSRKTGLMVHTMIETGLLVLIAVLLASVFTGLIIHSSHQFLAIDIPIDSLNSFDFAVMAFTMWISVTILSSIYPALTTFKIHSTQILRSNYQNSSSGFGIRQILIAFQFVVVQAMIIAIITAVSQMNYMNNKDLAFKTDGIVSLNIPEVRNMQKQALLKKELANIPGVKDISLGLVSPSSYSSHWWAGITNQNLEKPLSTRIQFIDENYLDFFDIELIEGRNLLTSDTSQKVALVNERVYHAMGLNNASEAIGEYIKGWVGRFRIVGVIEDYHSESLRDGIIPHALIYDPTRFYHAHVLVEKANQSNTIASIKETWSSIFPEYYFEYQFVEDDLKRFYENDEKFTRFLGLFTASSILISCLGLFGLIYFICIRKTKEIGIRKVLGAELNNVITAVAKGLMTPIIISMILGIPLIWYIMGIYLSNYSYSIGLRWEIFLLAEVFTIFVAALPVYFRARYAAQQNPIIALRDE